MTTHDSSSSDARTDFAEPDYESVGADIVVSHARDEMQMRVSALRHRLRVAFSATPQTRKSAARGAKTDD
jgi:hypothetical protein